MAAQLKKHSADQLRGITAYQQMKGCPSCGETRFRVLETRRQHDAQRRRYKCDVCGHRETRYEISQKSYEELIQLRRNFKALSKILIAQSENEVPDEVIDVKSEYQCASCRFYKESTSECSLDIPECGTEYANDCSSYIKDR